MLTRMLFVLILALGETHATRFSSLLRSWSSTNVSTIVRALETTEFPVTWGRDSHFLAPSNLVAVLRELPGSYVMSLEVFPRGNGTYLHGTWYNLLDVQAIGRRRAHFPSLFLCNDAECGRHKIVLQLGESTFVESPEALETDAWQTMMMTVDVERGEASLVVNNVFNSEYSLRPLNMEPPRLTQLMLTYARQ